jgi:acetyl-CoA carboxylase biotin carboxylase subunit
MFKKVLVANRGEIAVRVIRTLREMGIASVAIYSEPDRNALHVRMADEAFPVGPAPSSESYLAIPNVIDACRRSGAEAVHPGYGFLSENPHFVRALDDAGVTFIGPSAEAMEAMGSKTAARERMTKAGVPVVPGAHAGSTQELTDAAAELGYPVMLKAAAGGGGKGMRLVHKPENLVAAFERAQSEARSSFGDETVYVEKAIVEPRHVEIQVLADSQGHTVHLFERDCSIQRRHQKVIEETPSPAPVAGPDLIAQMGEVAVRAAAAVDYRSAGTVEFLLAPDGSFYFLEMNTRLQVEHPITELITGVDLVREQVRIAAGEPLGYEQKDITRRGAAIECRIYAEDPETGFLPSPGHIEVLRTPNGPSVRDDSGAFEKADIPSFYDPLISKLSVWAATREQAIDRMRRALSEYVVTGIKTNIPFHLRVMDHPKFKEGEYDTSFIEANRDELLPPRSLGDAATPLALGAAVAQALRDAEAAKSASRSNGAPAVAPTAQPSAWRQGALPRLR